MRFTRYDLPRVDGRTSVIGDDLMDIPRDAERTWVSVYFNWQVAEASTVWLIGRTGVFESYPPVCRDASLAYEFRNRACRLKKSCHGVDGQQSLHFVSCLVGALGRAGTWKGVISYCWTDTRGSGVTLAHSEAPLDPFPFRQYCSFAP